MMSLHFPHLTADTFIKHNLVHEQVKFVVQHLLNFGVYVLQEGSVPPDLVYNLLPQQPRVVRAKHNRVYLTRYVQLSALTVDQLHVRVCLVRVQPDLMLFWHFDQR